MAQRDYRTPQAPGALPSWMLSLGPNERPGHVMGNAEMDQYQNGGQPPTGSLGDYLINGFRGLTSIDPQGYAVSGHDPTAGDRVNRALQGLLKGYDTRNTAGNIGLQVGASFVPGGQIANSAAGAIQGATSDNKVFNRVLPTTDNSADPIYRPDVLPRGIYTGAPLESPAPAGVEGFGGGAAPGFAASPIGSRPLTPGQVSNPLQSPTSGASFTGGSGALVDPYHLPAEGDLLSLLANAQRYEGYDASTGRTGFAGSGGGDGYAYRGFDFAQDPGNRDIGKSAKYAFSEFAKQAAAAGAPQPRTKPEAEAWFNQYIAPKMQQAGYEIGWVQGDKARVKTREGWDEIDYLGNAGGDNPELTWQSEVLAPGGGMSTGPQGSGGSLPSAGMDLTSSALFEQLMQQVRDIAAGKSTGPLITDTNALLSLLKG